MLFKAHKEPAERPVKCLHYQIGINTSSKQQLVRGRLQIAQNIIQCDNFIAIRLF